MRRLQAKKIQIIILATKAQRNVLKLLGVNSMLDLSPSQPDDLQQIEKVGPVQVLSLPVALIRAQEVFFRTYATDAQIALRQVRDSSQLVRLLLHGEHSFIAGRLAGAFRAIGQPQVANDIAGAMTAAGYRVDELNPFASRWSPFSPERMPEQSSIVTTADGIAL